MQGLEASNFLLALDELQKEIDEAEADEKAEGLLGLLPPKPGESGIWRKAVEEETGDVYYYHTKTKETQWTKPDGYGTEEDDAWDADDASSASSDATSDGGNESREEEAAVPKDVKQVLQYAVYLGSCRSQCSVVESHGCVLCAAHWLEPTSSFRSHVTHLFFVRCVRLTGWSPIIVFCTCHLSQCAVTCGIR